MFIERNVFILVSEKSSLSWKNPKDRCFWREFFFSFKEVPFLSYYIFVLSGSPSLPKGKRPRNIDRNGFVTFPRNLLSVFMWDLNYIIIISLAVMTNNHFPVPGTYILRGSRLHDQRSDGPGCAGAFDREVHDVAQSSLGWDYQPGLQGESKELLLTTCANCYHVFDSIHC